MSFENPPIDQGKMREERMVNFNKDYYPQHGYPHYLGHTQHSYLEYTMQIDSDELLNNILVESVYETWIQISLEMQ